MSFDYDIAIIGAGPIGSTLAYELAKENLKVCLIDKKKVIGLPLQCAGIVNKRILDANDIPEDLILNKAKGAHLHTKNHHLTVSKDDYQALIIDRVAYDQFLYERAIDYGADSFLSSKVVSIDTIEGKVEFQSDSNIKTIRSKIIVGADGPLSLVSSTIGNQFNYFNASQYLLKVDEIDEMSFVDLYAFGDLFPGFIWSIPTYKNILKVGLFSNDDYKKQNEILDDFLKNDFKYDDYEVIEKYKGKIPIYNKENKLYENRALIIGDAASQVKPTTGGGLFIGFKAVQLAKSTIMDALKNKLVDKELSKDLDNDENNDLSDLSNLLSSYQENFEK